MKVKRLFSSFKPETYNLVIDVNEEDMTFTGTVVIHGQRQGRPSKRLTFHQKDLVIKKAVITHKDKQGHTVKELARINKHASFDEVRLHTTDMLFPGAYTVEMMFSGQITRNMNGMYPCFYEEGGSKKQLIATQFESHHAREVFPCIDEPEAKAVFNLSLKSRVTTVLSNTPVLKTELDGSRQTTHFEPTPIMSTYLLAFVIGDMSYKEAVTQRGIKVRAYSTPDNVAFTDFALETAVRCIDFYESFFVIEYPLPKCDLIALPDFASGAMENWGCITFREQCMLVDPANTSVGTKQYVAMVVAHELAHMWFGNLVTMRWWTDLWLNEGFASWVEYLATDTLFPEWKMWTQFVVDEQQPAMKLDALESTHPVQVPVHHPDEIRTIFDTISYSKGASVIHQLYTYVGPDSFRDGLNTYLKRHAYGNADTTDLWDAFSEASHKDIRSFMHDWTTLSGFPILTVNAIDKDQYTIHQSRFLLVKKHQEDDTSLCWPIPLFLTDNPNALLDKHKDHISIGSLPLNAGRYGFYRVSYDSPSLKSLVERLKEGSLDERDRLGLLADMLESCKTGDMSIVDTLDFMSNYKKEHSPVVWTVMAQIIGSIRLTLGDDEIRESIKPYIRTIATAEYERLGWDKKDDDTYFDVLLRPTIIALLASSDLDIVTEKCLQLYREIVQASDTDTMKKVFENIDPDLRSIVLGTIARQSKDGKEFDTILNLYDSLTLSEDRLTVASALCSFKDEASIEKCLSLLRTDRVRLQDIAYWLTYSLGNHESRVTTWNWVKNNWKWLEGNLGTDMSFSRMPIYIARVFNTKEFIIEYNDFFKPRLSPTLQRSFDQGNEMLIWQSEWKERDGVAIKNFLRNFQQQY